MTSPRRTVGVAKPRPVTSRTMLPQFGSYVWSSVYFPPICASRCRWSIVGATLRSGLTAHSIAAPLVPVALVAAVMSVMLSWSPSGDLEGPLGQAHGVAVDGGPDGAGVVAGADGH